ncbi:16143_t:CDS:2, partial [Gigaspora margarita]
MEPRATKPIEKTKLVRIERPAQHLPKTKDTRRSKHTEDLPEETQANTYGRPVRTTQATSKLLQDPTNDEGKTRNRQDKTDLVTRNKTRYKAERRRYTELTSKEKS